MAMAIPEPIQRPHVSDARPVDLVTREARNVFSPPTADDAMVKREDVFVREADARNIYVLPVDETLVDSDVVVAREAEPEADARNIYVLPVDETLVDSDVVVAREAEPEADARNIYVLPDNDTIVGREAAPEPEARNVFTIPDGTVVDES
jgi:hypothetical protein